MTRARGRDFPAIGKGFHGYYPTSIVTIAANISFRERETGCMKGPPSPSLPSFVDRRRPSFAAFAKKGQVFGTPPTPSPFLPTSAFRPLQRRIERAPFFLPPPITPAASPCTGGERDLRSIARCAWKNAQKFFFVYDFPFGFFCLHRWNKKWGKSGGALTSNEAKNHRDETFWR